MVRGGGGGTLMIHLCVSHLFLVEILYFFSDELSN